ncbi:MAG: hypothetical protein ACJA0V_004343, partial [Planctomycetota bacterium]
NPAEPAFRYVHSGNFPGLLEQLRLSLAVTTYQAGKLMIVRSAGGKLSTLLRSFERPMGLALSENLDRMVVGTRRTIWTLRSAPEIAPQLPPGRPARRLLRATTGTRHRQHAGSRDRSDRQRNPKCPARSL